jgi:hypothetical protein
MSQNWSMAGSRLKRQTTQQVIFHFLSPSQYLFPWTSGMTPPACTELSLHQASVVVNLYQNATSGKTQNRPIRSYGQYLFQRFDHGAQEGLLSNGESRPLRKDKRRGSGDCLGQAKGQEIVWVEE